MKGPRAMVYHGHFENGVVVFDKAPSLPDGTEVEVHAIGNRGKEVPEAPTADNQGQTLGQRLMKHAGKAVNLPSDASVNLDHYLYGAPKRKP